MGGMSMRKKVRFLLAGLLVADVLLIGYLMYDYIQNKIPDSVLTYVGEKQELDLPAFFKTEQSVPALLCLDSDVLHACSTFVIEWTV